MGKKIINHFIIDIKQNEEEIIRDESYLFVENKPISIIKNKCTKEGNNPVPISIRNGNELYTGTNRLGLKDGCLCLCGDLVSTHTTKEKIKFQYEGNNYIGYYMDIYTMDCKPICTQTFMPIESPKKERFVIAIKI